MWARSRPTQPAGAVSVGGGVAPTAVLAVTLAVGVAVAPAVGVTIAWAILGCGAAGPQVDPIARAGTSWSSSHSVGSRRGRMSSA